MYCFQQFDKSLILIRLGQIIINSELSGFLLVLFRNPRSQHYDWYILVHRLIIETCLEFIAVHPRHFDIENNNIREEIFQFGQGVQAVHRLLLFPGAALHKPRHTMPDADGVIHDEYLERLMQLHLQQRFGLKYFFRSLCLNKLQYRVQQQTKS